jgi:plasmid stabilization system protein ParE
MKRTLTLHLAAADELREAVLYYENIRHGLGEDLLQAVEAVFAQISRTPFRYPQVQVGVRRALLRRFPYGIFYRVTPDAIRVIAVFHAKRDPAHWRHRE